MHEETVWKVFSGRIGNQAICRLCRPISDPHHAGTAVTEGDHTYMYSKHDLTKHEARVFIYRLYIVYRAFPRPACHPVQQGPSRVYSLLHPVPHYRRGFLSPPYIYEYVHSGWGSTGLRVPPCPRAPGRYHVVSR